MLRPIGSVAVNLSCTWGCIVSVLRNVRAVALLAALTALGLSGCGERTSLQGAGASFPAPIYERWFKDYSDAHKGLTIEYQKVGSGAGVKAVQDHTVDFGASDAAMTDEEIAVVEEGVVMLPMTAGAVVLAYNVPDVKELKLSREAYAGIFLGKITKWNDPVIAACNPDAELPDLEITVIRRADSSGTTYVFTQHLSAVSQEWKDGPGTGKTVNWPESDKFLGAKGNDGIAQQVSDTAGAIGYIEYSYADQNNIPMAILQNKDGEYVKPSLESAKAALAAVELPENLRVWVPDPEGKDCYPIVTYTWLLCYKKYDDPKTLKILKDVIEYCLTEGQKISGEMGYVPLPDKVVEAVREKMKEMQAG